MRVFPATCFIFLAYVAACSTTTAGGGGGFVSDVQGCDAKSDPLCTGGLNFADTKGSDTILASDAATMSDVLAGTDAGGPDSAPDIVADTMVSDIDNFFDDILAGDDTATNDTLQDGICNARTKVIYVVTKKKQLVSFDPKTMAFKLIGTLSCPGAIGSPFSMSVDQNADAWVLYTGGGPSLSGGSVYKVSTLDASCQATSYVANGQGMELFGMGFAANAPGSQDETLFVTGTKATGLEKTKSTLATIATPTMTLTKVASLDLIGGCDLTGNGKGELYGFFAGTTPPTVRRIDTGTGTTIGTPWELPEDMTVGVLSWAFAQWGGEFYLFVKNVLADSSDVWKLDATTGVSTLALENIGYTITGAGVSQCAPTSKP